MSAAQRLWLGVGLPALGLAAAASIAAALSDHDEHAAVSAVLYPTVGLSFVAAGLVAWTRRPENGTGRLLALVGLLWFVNSLWEANDPALYTLGQVFAVVFLAAFIHLVVAFPRGRLETTMHRRLVAALYVTAFAAGLLPTLVSGSGCEGCPDSVIAIVDDDAAFDALETAFSAIGVVVFLAVVALLVRRWRGSTAAGRRALTPVYASAAIALGLLGTAFALDPTSDRGYPALSFAAFGSFGLLPLVFLASLVHTRLMRGSAARVLLEVPDEPTPREAQAGLRRVLGDPTLQLLVWMDERGVYADVEGNEFPLPTQGGRRAVRELDYKGRRLAALVYDPALEHSPDLFEEVLVIARLAIEKDRGVDALKRLEARTRAVLDALPDIMLRLSRGGTYLAARSGDDTALVVPPEELIGRRVEDVLPAPIAATFMRALTAALDEGGVKSVEYKLDLRGVVRDFEARIVRTSPDEAMALVRDFTQRRRLEAELAERLNEIEREQEFTRKVVNTAPVVILLVDLDGRILRFNDTTEQLLGYPDDDRVRGRLFWEVFLEPRHYGEALRLRDELRAGAPIVHGESPWRAADGRAVLMAGAATPIVDGQGITRYLICAQDITELVEQREELRAQRDFLGVIARAVPSLMAVVESDGTIAPEGVNPAFERATGYGDDVAPGRKIWDLVSPPELVEDVRRQFAESVEAGVPIEHETAWIGRSGEWRLVAWTIRPIALGRGRDTYLLSAVDVTDRKSQEEEVRRSRARIVEAADEARRRLERNLHDGAQQRLVSLSLSLRLAQRSVKTDPAAAERLIEGAAAELAQALEELRELARGIHPAVLSDRGLAPALEALVGRSPLPIELDAELNERLPAPVEAAAYYVVAEAITNVQKYAQASSVRVSAARRNGAVVVEVVDDGIGGADAKHGSGLRGLADRVEALDGRFELETAAGRGTTVRAVIPLGAEE